MNVRALTRPLRVLRARTRTAVNQLLHRSELRRGARLDADPHRTPIFILGAPRSGTTLLYQLLVEGLDVGWLSNAHLAWPGGVSAVERRRSPRAARTSSSWESSHGRTKESWEPSEAGPFWYRFVDATPHELTDADVTPARVAAVRAVVREFADACQASVVFKNVFNSLRVPLLARALPEARFILIERDVTDTARSLLVGRLQRGDATAWWSAVPAGSEEVAHASAAEQVVWQVAQLEHVARRELGRLAPDRTLRVSYEELCADPAALVACVQTWLTETGADVPLRTGAQFPAGFERRTGGELDPELEQQLQQAVAARQEFA